MEKKRVLSSSYSTFDEEELSLRNTLRPFYRSGNYYIVNTVDGIKAYERNTVFKEFNLKEKQTSWFPKREEIISIVADVEKCNGEFLCHCKTCFITVNVGRFHHSKLDFGNKIKHEDILTIEFYDQCYFIFTKDEVYVFGNNYSNYFNLKSDIRRIPMSDPIVHPFFKNKTVKKIKAGYGITILTTSGELFIKQKILAKTDEFRKMNFREKIKNLIYGDGNDLRNKILLETFRGNIYLFEDKGHYFDYTKIRGNFGFLDFSRLGMLSTGAVFNYKELKKKFLLFLQNKKESLKKKTQFFEINIITKEMVEVKDFFEEINDKPHNISTRSMRVFLVEMHNAFCYDVTNGNFLFLSRSGKRFNKLVTKSNGVIEEKSVVSIEYEKVLSKETHPIKICKKYYDCIIKCY